MTPDGPFEASVRSRPRDVREQLKLARRDLPIETCAQRRVARRRICIAARARLRRRGSQWPQHESQRGRAGGRRRSQSTSTRRVAKTAMRGEKKKQRNDRMNLADEKKMPAVMPAQSAIAGIAAGTTHGRPLSKVYAFCVIAFAYCPEPCRAGYSALAVISAW